MVQNKSNSPGVVSLEDSASPEQPTGSFQPNLAAPDGPESLDRAEAPKPGDDASNLYKEILHSEIGVSILLDRLKQSIASMRDFASFAKERGSIEEKHAASIGRLSESGQSAARRTDSRQGSYALSYGQVAFMHKTIAENGSKFGMSLSSVHADLAEMAADKERVRKQLKHDSLTAEKRVQDAELAMEKARGKYHGFAEDYDRVRTGDRQSGRFGLKGPKSAAQVEEDLLRKMQNADGDYSSKVQQAQGLRAELVNSQRPQAIQALEQHINEIDAALALHMQSFAKFNEIMILGNALCVSPPKNQDGSKGPLKQGFRDVLHQVDSGQDLRTYVLNYASKMGPKHKDPRYEAHPTQASAQQSKPMPQPLPPSMPQSQPASIANRQQMPPQQQPPPQHQSHPALHPLVAPSQESFHHQPPSQFQRDTSPFSPESSAPPNAFPDSHQYQAPPYGHTGSPPPQGPPDTYSQPPYQQPPHQPYPGYGAPPHDQLPHDQPPSYSQGASNGAPPPTADHGPHGAPSAAAGSGPMTTGAPSAAGPIFGISLDELFVRDGSAVPLVLVQCLQAVELYGLDVEGIYRMSGSQAHVAQLKERFDRGDTSIDFRSPEAFFHDVNNVAGLLKAFFKDLPDPLFTHEHYDELVEAAHIDDDIHRRDTLHGVVNNLPDAHYATLRALTLHMHRVAEHHAANKMNTGNLAICLAPTLMCGGGVPQIADAGWQVRTVDSIFQNALMIFDED